MKHCSFVSVVVALFVSFIFVCAAQALGPISSNSDMLTKCSSQELADLYRQAGIWGDVQLKRHIAEEIGERGAQEFAQNRGWDPILTKADKSAGHPQGFDQVWRSCDGKIHVVEAKGGESYLSTGKSGTQGTTEWCVKVAEKTLKNHAATEAEKSAARIVLDAASKGKLDIYVVQTPHIQGAAGNTICKEIGECTEEAVSFAKQASKQFAETAESGSKALTRGVTTMTEASRSIPTRPVPQECELPFPKFEPEVPVNQSAIPAPLSSGTGRVITKSVSKAGAKGVQATTQAASKTATQTFAKTAAEAAPLVGMAIDGGLRVKEAYEVEQMYNNGEIDNHERVVSHVKNGAGMAGGWSGAAAGGYAGASGGAVAGAAIGSVVPVVGTAIGGAVGSVVGGIGGAVGGYFIGEKAAETGVDCADSWFFR